MVCKDRVCGLKLIVVILYIKRSRTIINLGITLPKSNVGASAPSQNKPKQ